MEKLIVVESWRIELLRFILHRERGWTIAPFADLQSSSFDRVSVGSARSHKHSFSIADYQCDAKVGLEEQIE